MWYRIYTYVFFFANVTTTLLAFSPQTTTNVGTSRRPLTFLTATSNRRTVIQTIASTVGASLLVPVISVAAEETSTSITKSNNPFDAIRYELYDPKGGVAYMQSCIDKNDFASLLEFTKQYDQVLRKAAMGKAKKLLPTKELKEVGTAACNAVTFDLIGMNRNSRPSQENMAEVSKYLQELRQDAEKLLQLEESAVFE